jgi:hypothetical protein
MCRLAELQGMGLLAARDHSCKIRALLGLALPNAIGLAPLNFFGLELGSVFKQEGFNGEPAATA